MFALLLAAVLCADGSAAAPRSKDTRARDTAAVGMVTAALAMGLALLTPLADHPQPGTSPAPLILGSTAFAIVAFVRPVVFFSGQPARPPPTALNDTLRVLGTLTAVLGLGAFVSAFALRSDRPETAGWVMASAAGLEALSAFAFSLDAQLGLP